VLNKQQHKTIQTHWQQLFRAVPNAKSISVGFSGGADSTFLLLAIHQTLPPSLSLNAIHFNHGISAHSLTWQNHCQSICQQINIPLQIVPLKFDTLTNFEAEARKQRIEHIQQTLSSDQVYAMGHHANDQVETFFMKLFRGAGLSGLAAMRSIARFNHFTMWRPLLSFTKKDITQSLLSNNIEWIEDESNASMDFYRNQIRLETLPPLYQQVKHLEDRVLATTQVIQSNIDVLNDYLDADLSTFSKSKYCLSLSELAERGEAHISLLIHRFLDQLDLTASFTQITILTQAVLDKKYVEVWLKQKVVIVENNTIYVFDKLEPMSFCIDLDILNRDVEFHKWRLPAGLGFITARRTAFSQKSRSWISLGQLRSGQIISRPIGKIVHPVGRNHSVSLKKFLQECKIPKYLRKLMPVVVCSTTKDILCVPSVLTQQNQNHELFDTGFELTWSLLESVK
jgi:tRNA(Ile)-lysidine synthetase-like protein